MIKIHYIKIKLHVQVSLLILPSLFLLILLIADSVGTGGEEVIDKSCKDTLTFYK